MHLLCLDADVTSALFSGHAFIGMAICKRLRQDILKFGHTNACLMLGDNWRPTVPFLTRFLSSFRYLRTSIHFEHRGVVEVELLAGVLPLLPSLTSLNLGSNHLDTLGAEALALGLCHTKSLTALDIGYNMLGPSGAEHIARALPCLSQLRGLCMQGNDFGPSGATHISNFLVHVSALSTLRLGDNAVGHSGAARLADGLRWLPALTFFDIEGNSLTPITLMSAASDDQIVSKLAE